MKVVLLLPPLPEPWCLVSESLVGVVMRLQLGRWWHWWGRRSSRPDSRKQTITTVNYTLMRKRGPDGSATEEHTLVQCK